MGNTTANSGNLRDDEGEIYVAIDHRSVILDLPEEDCVSSLLLARGHTRIPTAAPARRTPAPPPLEPASFWHRLRLRARKPAAD
jgi:hypothetical protein